MKVAIECEFNKISYKNNYKERESKMNRKMYREIAKKHGVTVAEVKRDMQEAINEAYISPNQSAQGIKRKGDIPTPNEFINHIAKKIKDEQKEGGKK